MGAVFAEKFTLSIRILLNRPVFEKGDGIWIDVLSTVTKQYNSRSRSSTKLTPIQASLQNNEGYAYQSFLDKPMRAKQNMKFTTSLEQQI